MKEYNIKEEIQKFKLEQSKAYHYLYADSGFELGFGRGGRYSGHSHLFFYDILFSQSIISSTDANGNIISGNLIVIPQKTFIGEVQTDDFFFLKFCTTNDLVITPDKVDTVSKEGLISSFSNESKVQIAWYKNYLSETSFVKIDYSNNKMKLLIGEANSFLIL